jgi:hypothetical protein
MGLRVYPGGSENRKKRSKGSRMSKRERDESEYENPVAFNGRFKRAVIAYAIIEFIVIAFVVYYKATR